MLQVPSVLINDKKVNTKGSSRWLLLETQQKLKENTIFQFCWILCFLVMTAWVLLISSSGSWQEPCRTQSFCFHMTIGCPTGWGAHLPAINTPQHWEVSVKVAWVSRSDASMKTLRRTKDTLDKPCLSDGLGTTWHPARWDRGGDSDSVNLVVSPEIEALNLILSMPLKIDWWN